MPLFKSDGPSFHLFRTTDFTTIASAFTTIPWDAEVFDTSNGHDNATNNSRWTCSVPGLYLMTANTLLLSGAYGAGMITFANRFLVNGAVPYKARTSTHTGTGQPSVDATALIRLAVGDYVEYQVARNDGFPGTAIGGDKSYTSWEGVRVAP